MTFPSRHRALLALSCGSILFITACSGPVTTTDAGNDAIANQEGGADVTADGPIDVQSGDAGVDARADTAADVPVDAAPDVTPVDAGCAFDTTYTYGSIGGFRVAPESTTLAPQASYTRTRTPSTGSPISCMQTVPCGTSGLLDVLTVNAAIFNADVQTAMAIGTDTLYGVDTRPVDGSVFSFQRASDGHSILVGSACSGGTGCTPIPAGVAALVTTLQNLDTQEIAMTGCEALR